MKIEYTPAGKGSKTPKPYATLVMCGKEKRVRIDGLIDSGSDHNLFPVELAEICGIDLRNATRVRVSGFNHDGKKGAGYLISVKFVLGNLEWMGDTVFVKTKQPHGILGQRGFFDAFDVVFSFTQRTIELKPITAQAIDSLRG